jgi:hypothetical protein
MPIEPARHMETTLEPARTSWSYRLWKIIFILFCFELGVFLLVFPWLDYWDSNSIASLAPWLENVWNNPYFRGALSGLGVVNIYISLVEVFRLRRSPAGRMKLSSL